MTPTQALTTEEWMRNRWGAYRGHFAWREIEEAFNAGAALSAAPVEPVAPIYQLQGADGRWIDQTWSSYDYNKRYGQTVRVVYAAPVPAEPAPAWQPIETEGGNDADKA